MTSLLDALSHGVDLPGEEDVEGVGLFFTSRRDLTARIGFTPVGFRFGGKPSGNGRTGFHRGLKLSQFVEGAFQAAGQIRELDLETFVVGIAQGLTMPRVRSRNESLEVRELLIGTKPISEHCAADEGKKDKRGTLDELVHRLRMDHLVGEYADNCDDEGEGQRDRSIRVACQPGNEPT
ncbi:hypothetical protein ACQP2T_38415 [Nonomuraea sp. CA-143628]|uniref:hypothetical protein n=1 Tax=Nonomuraea sp. CA-143628 TaxID=3239997 RepID=UPI003D92C9AC